MSPRPRPGDVYPLPPDVHPREAGGLILLYPGREGLRFFLTLRTERVESHKGQVSLPGGAQEKGELLQETALREAAEEMGIDPTCVEILDGPLSPVYIPVSNFRLTPFVGFTPARPDIRAAPEEVVEIIETPLDLIADERNIREEYWNLREYYTGRVPFFAVGEFKVWGATGMVLGEFSEMLRQAKDHGVS